jgi:branched-chain amino acid transport system substrate-binding protein
MRIRNVGRLLFVLALVLTVASCSSDDDSGAGSQGGGEAGPIKIGYAASISGPGAVFFDNISQSAKLAVDEVNKAGGVLGRQLQLEFADDAGDPKTSNQICTRLIFDTKVDVIIGAQNSANREGCLPVATREGMPYLYATPYEGKECAPNFFVDGETPPQQVNPLVQYMTEEKKANKWFLSGSDYVAMRGGNQFAKQAITELGGQVVGEQYASLGTTDFTPLIDKILRSGADTLMGSFLGTDYIAFLKQWNTTPGKEKINFSTFGIPIGAGDAVKNLYTAFSYFPTIDTPANQKYKAALNSMFSEKASLPSVISVPSYDFVHLYALAVNKAGTTDKAAVIKAMHEVTFDGPSGPIAFNEQGHAKLPMFIAVMNGDPLAGKETILKTIPPTDPGDNDDGDCAK